MFSQAMASGSIIDLRVILFVIDVLEKSPHREALRCMCNSCTCMVMESAQGALYLYRAQRFQVWRFEIQQLSLRKLSAMIRSV